jgi:endoglucanase
MPLPIQEFRVEAKRGNVDSPRVNPKEFASLARRLMSCPAAPYYEAGVRAVVELICTEHGLAVRRDRFGNVIVRLGNASSGRPFVLAAHMDHPGFEIVRPLGTRRWIARFNGGVPDSYFHPGIPVRLLPGDLPARLGRHLGADKQFEIIASRIDLNHRPQPGFAVWELEDFAVRNGRIHGRSCDDLIGVASVLATMIELKRTRSRVHVIGVISRAEEIGFQGALTVADAKLLPRNSIVVSLETSKELPPTKMGQGVILRVGDRSSIFDSAGMRFLGDVAAGLQAKDRKFQFQRALMFGGTCEATAFQEFGYQVAAMCVALGNYHNCHPKGRIAAEYVSLADACGMVRLLIEAARQMRAFGQLTAQLPKRLRALLKQARQNLRRKT